MLATDSGQSLTLSKLLSVGLNTYGGILKQIIDALVSSYSMIFILLLYFQESMSEYRQKRRHTVVLLTVMRTELNDF